MLGLVLYYRVVRIMHLMDVHPNLLLLEYRVRAQHTDLGWLGTICQ